MATAPKLTEAQQKALDALDLWAERRPGTWKSAAACDSHPRVMDKLVTLGLAERWTAADGTTPWHQYRRTPTPETSEPE